ncbi:MAG: hypothetical protein B6244_13395, partial [Candidatus Cloacimonetes bacterium 4572_55]
MRTLLDEVDPKSIKPVFKDIFRQAQRGKVLEPFAKRVHCENYLEKVNKKSGEITYHHQIFGGSIVHPDVKGVIPLV